MESHLLKWIYPTMIWIGLGALSNFPIDKGVLQSLKTAQWGTQWRATASMPAAIQATQKGFFMMEREKDSDSNTDEKDEAKKPVIISPDRDL